MPNLNNMTAGPEPAPVVTYKNPRRVAPENSITLRHHRTAREASRRPSGLPTVTSQQVSKSPRRNSSGESHDNGASEPRKWFDRSNENASGNIYTTSMDVDPPFFQKETDSSNEGGPGSKYIPTQSPAYRFVQSRGPVFRPDVTQSSSTDDYRSVIDDLTVENKRLKEELKKYKQMGPDSLRQDQLFEVKIHGLPSCKKRELEAALRDFTTSLEGSSTGGSPSRKQRSGKSMNLHSSTSKHASSSSGSNSRPVDSAYASMSVGPSSSPVPSLPGATKSSRKRSHQAVQNYLRDIPEGLWPRASVMTEMDKKKLVVKRLEHIFTGKLGRDSAMPTIAHQPTGQVVQMGNSDENSTSRESLPTEAHREACIRPNDLKASHSRDNGSISYDLSHSQSRSQVDPTETRNGSSSRHDCGNGGRSNTNISPTTDVTESAQRPTRPKDLDPDRKQNPSENMDYIRHLGLVAPAPQSRFSAKDVSPDAEGWVYLNLLCNMAQLHMFNVAPDFIRSAVSEKSTKFQLSSDGRKIRWRGGEEGTKFSSESSGSNSQRQQSSDETDGSNGQDHQKKQRTDMSGNDVISQKPSRFGLGVQNSATSESFHYKPLFAHHRPSSSDEDPSGGDDTGSSRYLPEESTFGTTPRWGQSGISTGFSPRKRRRDGAIIYYSGAPFCTDLSGDCGGEVFPDSYDTTSSGDQGLVSLDGIRPLISRSSGSSLSFKPLSGPKSHGVAMDLDASDPPELTSGETDDDIDADFPWSDGNQRATLLNMEASGLSGIYPDDHFVVVVSTRRPKKPSLDDDDSSDDDSIPRQRPRITDRSRQETTDLRSTIDSINSKLATMTTQSPVQPQVFNARVPTIEIEYLRGRVRKLPPVPLPPPAFYFPTSDSDVSDDEDSGEEDGSDLSEVMVDGRPNLEDESSELAGNEEEDEHEDDVHFHNRGGRRSSNKAVAVPSLDNLAISRGQSSITSISRETTASSVATAGGAGSGYSSSMEE